MTKAIFFGWVWKQDSDCVGIRGGYFLRSGDKQHGTVINMDDIFDGMLDREVVITIDDGGDV